ERDHERGELLRRFGRRLSGERQQHGDGRQHRWSASVFWGVGYSPYLEDEADRRLVSPARARLFSKPPAAAGGPAVGRSVGRSGAGPGRLPLLPHGGEHLVGAGEGVSTLPGDLPAVDQERQLALASGDGLDLDPGLLQERRRQTGGVFAERVSDRAVTD